MKKSKTQQIKTELIGITNSNYEKEKRKRKAAAYSAYCNAKYKRKVASTMIVTILICCFLLFEFYIAGKADTEVLEAEEKIRTETRTESAVLIGFDNGTGDMILQTEDGHQWKISDPPEVCYSITFDTKGTADIEDDEIIGLE